MLTFITKVCMHKKIKRINYIISIWRLYQGPGQPRIFVTIPRFQLGVPITLGVLTGTYGQNGPKIAAFPSYAWQSSNGTDCKGITSVFRIAVSRKDP